MSLFEESSERPAVDAIIQLLASAGVAQDTPRNRTPARKMTHLKTRAHSPTNDARLQAEYESAYGDPLLAPIGAGQAGRAQAPIMPRVKQPLRVEPPQDFNIPPRVDLQRGAEDENLSSLERIAELSVKVAKKAPRRTAPGGESASAEKLRDYALLARSAKRAGRPGTAGLQQFRQGALFDNVTDYPQAIKSYKAYLEACAESGDLAGEALACNSIGVDYQLAGGAHLAQAEHYHRRHLEVADVPGKYIAHVNLGLCCRALGRDDEAVSHHQHALRYAIRMCSLAGESLACGNLGQIASAGDIPTAKACAERQLQLARSLNDSRGKGDAYRQLGVLSSLQGDHGEAVHYFQQAMQLARAEGNELASNSARCGIGVARGNAGFEGLLRSLASGSGAPPKAETGPASEPQPGSASS